MTASKFTIVAAVSVLAGCASTPDFWFPEPAAKGEVAEIRIVDAPCGDPNLPDCWSPALQIGQVNSKLSLSDQECAKKHIRKHAEGFDHKQGGVIKARLASGRVVTLQRLINCEGL